MIEALRDTISELEIVFENFPDCAPTNFARTVILATNIVGRTHFKSFVAV